MRWCLYLTEKSRIQLDEGQSLRRGEPGYEEARFASVWNARTPGRFPDVIAIMRDADSRRSKRATINGRVQAFIADGVGEIAADLGHFDVPPEAGQGETRSR